MGAATISWIEDMPVHIANPVIRDSLWCCRDTTIRATNKTEDIFTLPFLGYIQQDKVYVFVRIKATTLGRAELRLYDKNSNFKDSIYLDYVNKKGESVTLANADIDAENYYLLGNWLPLEKLLGKSGEVRIKIHPRHIMHSTKDYVVFVAIGDTGDFWVEDFPDIIDWVED